MRNYARANSAKGKVWRDWVVRFESRLPEDSAHWLSNLDMAKGHGVDGVQSGSREVLFSQFGHRWKYERVKKAIYEYLIDWSVAYHRETGGQIPTPISLEPFRESPRVSSTTIVAEMSLASANRLVARIRKTMKYVTEVTSPRLDVTVDVLVLKFDRPMEMDLVRTDVRTAMDDEDVGLASTQMSLVRS